MLYDLTPPFNIVISVELTMASTITISPPLLGFSLFYLIRTQFCRVEPAVLSGHGLLRRGGEPELEFLFVDLGAPVVSPPLLYQCEAVLVVEVSRRVEALKAPQKQPLVAPVPAKVDSGVDQPVADASAAQGIRDDEPPDMGSLVFSMEPVDGNRAFNAPLQRCRPEAVTLLVIPPDELGKLGSYPSLEEMAETPVLVVVGAVKFDNSTDSTGDIAAHYFHI